MTPNPIMECSYVVLNFWPNLSLVVLKKKRVIKKKLQVVLRLVVSSGGVSHWRV